MIDSLGRALDTLVVKLRARAEAARAAAQADAQASWDIPVNVSDILALIEDRERRMMTFTCPSCAARDERSLPDAVPPPNASTSDMILFLQRHVERTVRNEIRDALDLDAPKPTLQKPPSDLQVERSLCASALAGLRWPGAHRLKREHFYSPINGIIWELCSETDGKPHLGTIASQIELKRLGNKREVIQFLKHLTGPWQAATCSNTAIDRILELAWQRDLYASAQCLTAMLGSAHPVIGAIGFDDRIALRARLLDMVSTLEGGPHGDPVLAYIERVVEENSGDTASPAQKARAAKFAVQRDLVFQAASVVGWLKKDDSVNGLVEARDRLVKYIARLDTARDHLHEIWSRLVQATQGAPP